MDPFIGEIRAVGFDYAPQGWAFCNGQLLNVQQNQALFALLGNRYGGDGVNNFALPDLRGRCAIGYGQGPGLTNRVIAEQGGVESVTLNTAEIPTHSHQVYCSSETGDSNSPVNRFPGGLSDRMDIYKSDNPDQTMNEAMIRNTGGSQAHYNMQPYLAINYVIALTGIFPVRS